VDDAGRLGQVDATAELVAADADDGHLESGFTDATELHLGASPVR
jgi:hypothetical protein